MNDHLLRRSLKLTDTDFLVLDETDRMLDMGFGIQLDQIVKFLPEKRQTLMFSATLPANIISLSKNISPIRNA
ncbi:MAG: DEAD/DEAH box helicase [Alphaproteobacteria bacterium]